MIPVISKIVFFVLLFFIQNLIVYVNLKNNLYNYIFNIIVESFSFSN